MDGGDHNGHFEIGIYEGVCRLVASVEIGGPAEPEINRHMNRAGFPGGSDS
jgi:hypothetical protein